VSLIFCKALLALRRAVSLLPASTSLLQPAFGGIAIGGLLLAVPEIKGVGYEYVDQALNGGLVLRTLVILCLVKLAATVISYSSGNAGGIFAPSLYIGAMVGGVIGTIMNRLALFPTSEPGAYALVGMGTLFAGIIRAPMTSVFMIFEITQDYQILVPLMVANLLSFVISRRFQPVPVYEALLHQDGIHLPAATVRSPVGWTAGDVMDDEPRFVSADTLVDTAWDAISADGRTVILVGTTEHTLGIVTRDELTEARHAGRGAEPLAALVDETFAHVHPDHSMDVVLERLADSGGLLPVVSRVESQRLLGVIAYDDIAKFAKRRADRRMG
jgi:CIC family chloride channel protein